MGIGIGYGLRWYQLSQSNSVPVVDPTGVVTPVPVKLFNGSLQAGGEPAYHLTDRSGRVNWVRLSRLQESINSGSSGIGSSEKQRILDDLPTFVNVDESWVEATRSCWLGLASQADGAIRFELSHPQYFRVAFPKYVNRTDRDAMQVAAKPVKLTISAKTEFIGDGDITSAIVADNPTLEKTWYILGPEPRLKDMSNEWLCDVNAGTPERR